MASLLPLAGGLHRPEHVNRACEACRLLKVRCLPSPDPLSTICTRCTKTGRNCQYAAPQKRRPRKRTDTRVAELEREVKAMRSMLNKQGRQNSGSRSVDGDLSDQLSRKASATSYNGSDLAGGSSTSVSSPDKGKQRSETPPSTRHSGHARSGDTIDEAEEYNLDNPDIIDRGLITVGRAKDFFAYWVTDMIPQSPLVTLRTDETFEVIRAQKPILFLVIVTSVSGILDGDLFSTLHDETMHVFAEHYILNCAEKSLEMIQAFILTALWLYPPDDFRKLKFYQYTHMAASMMLDIGPEPAIPVDAPSDGATKASEFPEADGRGSLIHLSEGEAFEEIDHCYPLAPAPLNLPLEMKNEPLVVESRRTYVACYLLCSNVALSLRRPNMLTYSPFIAACISFLKRSPYASQSDRQLAAWVEMQHIADECAEAFSAENASLHEMSDPRLQLTLKGFEARLEDWWKSLDPGLINPCLTLHYHQNRIFIQEFAIMVKHGNEPMIQTRLVDAIYGQPNQVFSTARANAILVVVESAHALLDVIINLDKDMFRAMPVVNWARTVLAVILLIKMCATANVPNSELSKIIDCPSIKVEYYLMAVAEKMQALSEYKVASKFLPIIIKVAIWFYQNSDTTKKGPSDLIAPLLGLAVQDDKNPPPMCALAGKLGTAAEAIEASEKKGTMPAEIQASRLPDVKGLIAENTGLVADLFQVHPPGPLEAPVADSPDTDTPSSSHSQRQKPGQAPSQGQPRSRGQAQGGMVNQLPLPDLAEQVPPVEGMDWFHPSAEGGGLFGGGEMDIDIFALTEEAMQYGEVDLMNQWFPGVNEPGFFMEQEQQQGQQQQQQNGQNGNWQWN